MMKNILLLVAICMSISLTSIAQDAPRPLKLPSDTLKKGKNYILFSKTKGINSISFNKTKKSKDNIIYIRIGFPEPMPTSNAVGGAVSTSKEYAKEITLPVFDKIDILKGKYTDIKNEKNTKYRNLFTFSDVEFPLRLKLFSGAEIIDLELTEAGEWNIGIELKNN